MSYFAKNEIRTGVSKRFFVLQICNSFLVQDSFAIVFEALQKFVFLFLHIASVGLFCGLINDSISKQKVGKFESLERCEMTKNICKIVPVM